METARPDASFDVHPLNAREEKVADAMEVERWMDNPERGVEQEVKVVWVREMDAVECSTEMDTALPPLDVEVASMSQAALSLPSVSD